MPWEYKLIVCDDADEAQQNLTDGPAAGWELVAASVVSYEESRMWPGDRTIDVKFRHYHYWRAWLDEQGRLIQLSPLAPEPAD